MTDRASRSLLDLWQRITAIRWRVAWGYFGAVLLLLLADPTPRSILAGIPLVVVGEAIRIVANGSLVKDKAFTNWGIYAHIRHPLYLGSTLIGIGFMIMAWNVILAGVMVVLFLSVYRRTIKHEEEWVAELFGDEYRRWAASVGRFLPRRWAPREIKEHFMLRRAWINREQNAVLGVTGVTVILYLKYLLLG